MLVTGFEKEGVFVKLKNSARNSRRVPSRSLPRLKSLKRPKSQSVSPGPFRMLTPEFPNVNGAGTAKAATLNQSWMVGFGKAPFPIRLGLILVPVLAGSVPIVGVNGKPDWAVTMFVILHPPSACPTMSVRFFKNGRL